MPKGFDGVREVAADVEARRAAGGSGTSSLWFKLPDSGDEGIVRFLDDEPTWAYMHQVPVAGRAWGDDVPCLDQEGEGIDCPGCEADLKKKFKGFVNIIWDEAPVFQRDKEGKIVKDKDGDAIVEGEEPQVAILSSGIRMFEELDEVAINYKGLTSRRFRIKRKGTGLDTKYVISPEDPDEGKQVLSKSEKKLAEDKQDLNPFVTPPSYEDFEKKMNGQSTSGGGGGSKSNGSSKKSKNPFLARKNEE